MPPSRTLGLVPMTLPFRVPPPARAALDSGQVFAFSWMAYIPGIASSETQPVLHDGVRLRMRPDGLHLSTWGDIHAAGGDGLCSAALSLTQPPPISASLLMQHWHDRGESAQAASAAEQTDGWLVELVCTKTGLWMEQHLSFGTAYDKAAHDVARAAKNGPPGHLAELAARFPMPTMTILLVPVLEDHSAHARMQAITAITELFATAMDDQNPTSPNSVPQPQDLHARP